MLVELVLEKFKDQKNEPIKVADLGTGCGAIALALAHENPAWQIYATDNNHAALLLAQENAKRLQIQNVVFCQGSWCDALPDGDFAAIISNPPYIAKDDLEVNPDVIESEPHSALFSADHGLAALSQIIQEAKKQLKTNGYLLLEHGCHQANAVAQLFDDAGYTGINLYKDFSGLDRVTIGCCSVSIAS